MQNETSYLTSSILSDLEGLHANVTTDVSERAKAQKLLTSIVKALRTSDFDLVAQNLSKGFIIISEVYPQSKPILQKLQIDVSRRVDEQLRQTSEKIEEYCQSKDIPFKKSGTKFVVDNFIEIELDRHKGRTRIGNLSLSTFKWDKVSEGLDSERARLWKRGFDAARFRDKLIKAYKQLAEKSTAVTDWITLDDIYQSLKRQIELENPDWKKGGRLIPYYKDEFSADLSMLWREQASKTIETPYIELSAIRDPRKSYKVLQPDNNLGFFGFLRPRGG